ncbi:MAG TPA: twin-arginine translocase TatA/TatE family subunit [Isosphaeraceae bacterium]|jgi:sec-independent protein translocase protein TatA|nr:twin-arginine translocase TatA/TatE family subunit [Isosphaeraceae bacterium]
MFPSLGMAEMVVIMMIAVLLFGKRLPEVARSLGKGMVEFKKGLRGIEDELHGASNASSYTFDRQEDRPTGDHVEPSVPKFEPPSAAPEPKHNVDEPQPYQD